ncbi:hypothetical protein BDR04DRAFT_1039669, partial [Suillus decipiens]
TNLKNGQGFTVNIISEAFVENANATAIDAPHDFNDNSISCQAHLLANHVTSQHLYKLIDITHPVTGEQNNMLILLHAKYTHICKDMLTEKGVINLTKFKLIVHLGNILYA